MSEPRTPNLIDETIDESFPASDPPAWTGTHAGPPKEREPPHVANLRTVPCAFRADEAVARIEHAVVSAGMKVFARIDQAAEARAVGLAMPAAVVLLFGNPKSGTPLMIARPTVAIDLPLRAVVWDDDRGQTWLSYNTPALLVERHGVDSELAARLAPAGALLERAVRA